MYRYTLLLLTLAAAVATACRRHEQPVQTPPLHIEIETAILDSAAVRRTFISEVASNYDAVIQPRVNGFLAAKHYDSGMPVRKGQLLFEIDPSHYSTTLLAAQAALESARAEALEAKNNYDRAVPLARINAISGIQLDQYTTQYAASQAAVKSAEQQVRNARLEMGYTRIYSPIDGIIESTPAHIGDYVGPGTQFRTLTTISNIDTVNVTIAIPMAQYLQLGGERAMLYDNSTLLSDIVLYEADGSRYPIEGAYDYTRTDVSNTTGTIVLVATFPNPDYRLKTGQFARIETNIGNPRPRILVPQRSVSQLQDVSIIWVVRADSTVEYRRVTTGGKFGERWEITSGINPGERVAVSGLQKLKQGAKVVPAKPQS